jgi:ParB family chromosome partitioning protein
MTTTAAAENLGGRPVVEKKDEKVEKRRALGRGLESLLPGPRVVKSTEYPVPSTESSAPQGLKPESSPAMGGTAEAVPFPTSMEQTASEETDETRAGAAAPHLAESAEVISIQAQAMPGNLVVNLDIELIEKNPYQTRYVFDQEMLLELAYSIKEHGVVQPVVVRPAEGEEGRYILVLGERRLRASKMAGKETIPALVRKLSLQQAAEMTVLENVVREDLNCIEQAEAFRVLSKEFHLTQAQIAERIGVSRETVSNYMRLLRLPEKVMGYMLADRLSFSDAREILRLENEELIEQVAEEVVTHKLKWDQIEDRVMRINGSSPMLPGQTMPGAPKKEARGARWMDPNVRSAQTEMERTLGMRVRIKDRNGKGKIVIEYATVDDYERVTGMLRGKSK